MSRLALAKSRWHCGWVALLGCVLAAGVARAVPEPEPTGEAKSAAPSGPALMVGDKAPELFLEDWVRGEPVQTFEPGKVYLIEFWATWCQPCVRGMPHLTDLQATNKDRGLVVIGVAIDQPGGAAEVKAFLDKRFKSTGSGEGGGARIGYSIAVDKERRTDRAWRQAAGSVSIPFAMIVDKDGLLAWAGYPDRSMDAAVESILAGTFDTKASAAQARKAQSIMSRANEAWANDRPREALELLDELVALDASRYAEAARIKLGALLVQLADADGAVEYAQELVDGTYAGDAGALASIARVILESRTADPRLKELARAATQKAVRLGDRENAALMETLAEVYFLRGELGKAVEFQTQAVSAASSAERPGMQQRLGHYKAEQQRAATGAEAGKK